MKNKLISLQDLSYTVSDENGLHFILSQVTLDVYEGEHYAIVGANGAGKSTLLSILRGELWADQNISATEIAPFELEYSPMPPPITWYNFGIAETSPIMGRRMTGLVSAAKQERYVRHEWRITGEDILLTAFSDSELLHYIPEQKQKDAAAMMAQKLSCEHLLQQEACAMSQGQLRLLMLGRVLLRAPKVLLLDEYLEGLDKSARQRILKALENCNSTLIFTGHRADSFPSWVKNTYVLQNGELEKKDLNESIFEALAPDYEQKKLAALTSPPCDFSAAPIHMTLEDVSVFINRKPILHHVTWQWHQGEHWFLHGANGAGKSTLLRLLAGEEYPAFGGSIQRYNLKDTEQPLLLRSREEIQNSVRLISDKEQMTYGYDVTALEFVLSGLDNVQGQYRVYTFDERLAGLKFLSEFGLKFIQNRRISQCTTGYMRRLLIARALIGEPEILLLDEPFSGLDGISYMQVKDLLMDISKKVSILMVSHHEEDILQCINNYAMMEKGILRKL